MCISQQEIKEIAQKQFWKTFNERMDEFYEKMDEEKKLYHFLQNRNPLKHKNIEKYLSKIDTKLETFKPDYYDLTHKVMAEVRIRRTENLEDGIRDHWTLYIHNNLSDLDRKMVIAFYFSYHYSAYILRKENGEYKNFDIILTDKGTLKFSKEPTWNDFQKSLFWKMMKNILIPSYVLELFQEGANNPQAISFVTGLPVKTIKANLKWGGEDFPIQDTPKTELTRLPPKELAQHLLKNLYFESLNFPINVENLIKICGIQYTIHDHRIGGAEDIVATYREEEHTQDYGEATEKPNINAIIPPQLDLYAPNDLSFQKRVKLAYLLGYHFYAQNYTDSWTGRAFTESDIYNLVNSPTKAQHSLAQDIKLFATYLLMPYKQAHEAYWDKGYTDIKKLASLYDVPTDFARQAIIQIYHFI